MAATKKEVTSFAETLRNLGPTAVSMILTLAGIALAIAMLNFMAYKVNKTAGVNVLGYFNPVQSNWGIYGTVIMISIMMMVVLPVIGWILTLFRSGLGGTK